VLSIKDIRSQGEGVVQCGYFVVKGEESSDADIRTFWCTKFYGAFARIKGKVLGQYGHFSDKGGWDQFFAILCGRLLWTATYVCDPSYTDEE